MTSTGAAPVNDVDLAGANPPVLPPLALEELDNIPAVFDASHSQMTSSSDFSEALPSGSPLDSPTTLQKKLLPIPAKKDADGNPSFILTEPKGSGGVGEFELPPEISNADLSIAGMQGLIHIMCH